MLGALLGRVVEWAVHRIASQVAAYSQLCDQGHLRNYTVQLKNVKKTPPGEKLHTPHI